MDHLDGVHQSREGLLDVFWVANIQRLEVLLEGLKVLDVVLGLRERLSDFVVNASPVGGGHVDLLIMDTKRILHLIASLIEKVIDGTTVLASKLLGDLSQFSHTLFPVLEFPDRTIIFIIAACCISVLDVGVDLVLPSAEDLSVVDDERDLLGATLADTGALLLTERVKDDIGLERLLGFHELFGEFVKSGNELLLLVNFTHFPLRFFHLAEHGLVDVVDEGLEDTNGML